MNILITFIFLLFSFYKDGLAVSTPKIIAHRGARSLAPENTLAAARAAWKVGADGWEFDVQMTKDRELILMHDETLIRTTNVRQLFPERTSWSVRDFTLAEIKQLDAGSWFVDQDPFGTISSGEVTLEEAQGFRGERVPTLKEALLLSKELGLWVNIEIKGQPSLILSSWAKEMVERTVAQIRELEIEDRVLVSSFDPAMIQYLKQIAPEIAGAVLVKNLPVDPVGYLRGLGADALNPRYDLLTLEAARNLREAGYAIYVWTVNEPEDLARFATNPYITGIITDWPQRLQAILDGLKRQ